MRIIVVVILSSLVFGASAQDRAYIDVKYKKLNLPLVTSLTDTNAFFFFSSDNLLWFSTRQGLTSFDGTEIISYYPDTSESIKYGLSNITAMAEDKNNNFWITGQTSDATPTLIYFDTRSKKISKINTDGKRKSLSERLIEDMLIDSSGRIVMSTHNNGFYIYDPRDSAVEYHQIGYNLDNDNYRTCITTDPKNHNNLWVATANGIFLFNLKTKQAEKKYEFPHDKKTHFTDYPINIVYMDQVSDSILCIGTGYYGMGIYNIKRNTLTMIPPSTRKTGTSIYRTVIDGYKLMLTLPCLELYSVAKKSSNEYYVYYRDSLPLIFNCSTQKYQQLRNPGFTNEIKIKNGAAKLRTDKKGNLWIGESKYLYVISDEFNLFTSKESPDTTMHYPVSSTTLWSVIWDKRIKNYYATVLGSPNVYLLNSNFQVIKNISTPFHGVITFLIQDSEGNIWAVNWGGVRGGISICRNGSDHFEPAEKIYPQLSSLGDMMYITSDNKNNIIFSKENGNLFFLDITTSKLDSLIFPKIDSSLQFNFNELSPYLYYDTVNNYVYVSNKKNVLQYDWTKKSYKIFTKDSSLTLNKTDISYFSFDKNGQVWTSKRNKIQIYDKAEFKLQKEILLKNSRNEKFTIIGLFPGPTNYMFVLLEGGMILYNYNNDSYTLFDKENGLLHDDFRLTYYANDTYISAFNNSIQFAAFDKLLSSNNERTSKINQVKIYNNKMISFEDLSNNNIQLSYKRNTIGISFSAIEYLFPERIQYAFRLSAVDSNWKYVDYKNREIIYSNLRPGKYVFELKAQVLGGNWEQDPLKLYITITPPFWQTWWFRTIAVISIIGLLYLLFRIKIASLRKKDHVTARHEKELLELEAKALRAQMNPHFIFNCMNSIKALIQNDEKQRSIEYLTTFSKLIRTLFQNSDKRQISLFDEIETCRLYTQLESMRLNGKLKYSFDIDPNLDLKSVLVPALIIQPFIENSIWHGIVPKDEGTIKVTVKGNATAVICEVDDNGIGREMSKLNKPVTPVIHESKGVHLSQVRLDLEKMLNETQATIETIDKDKNNIATGTTVKISFNMI